MSPLDYPSADYFNPQNIEHWLLLVSFIGFSIYSVWLVNIEEKQQRPTHRYNRETRKVERNED
jgi:hypothetical protein